MSNEKSPAEKLAEKHDLTVQEAEVVLRRTDGNGDVDAAVAQIKSERIGAARLHFAARENPNVQTLADVPPDAPPAENVPLVTPGDWPGVQGTDQPPPDVQLEKLDELAAAEAEEKPARHAHRGGSK